MTIRASVATNFMPDVIIPASGCGGAIVLLSSTAKIDHSTFINCNSTGGGDGGGGGGGGGAVYAFLSDVSLIDSIGNDNRALSGGSGGFIAATSGATVTVFNSSFARNQAFLHGGAVSLVSSTLTATGKQSRFRVQDNIALTGSGGAFYLDTSSLSVTSGSVAQNSAPRGGGGAIFWRGTSPEPLATAVFAPFTIPDAVDPNGNTALFGNTRASEMVRIGFADAASVNTISATPQISGGDSILPSSPVVALLDYYNQTVRSDTRVVTVSSVNGTILTGSTVLNSGVGVRAFSIGVVKFPGTTSELIFSALGFPEIRIPIVMANCPPSQFADVILNRCNRCVSGFVYNSSLSSCRPCDAGSASMGSSTNCTKCTTGSISAIGANECTPCPFGTWAVDNQRSCGRCNSGQGVTADGTGCQKCDAGAVSTNGVCAPCELGKFSSGAEATPTVCSLCGKCNISRLCVGVACRMSAVLINGC